jgi:hypothetical protein
MMFTLQVLNHIIILSFFLGKKFQYKRTTILRAFSTPLVQCLIISIDKLSNK